MPSPGHVRFGEGTSAYWGGPHSRGGSLATPTVIKLKSSALVVIGRICLVVLTSALLFAVPARAQSERRAPSLRLFTGVGVTGASDLRIRQSVLGTDLTFEQVAWEHKSLSTEWTRDSIPYVGARAEFFFREPNWLGV